LLNILLFHSRKHWEAKTLRVVEIRKCTLGCSGGGEEGFQSSTAATAATASAAPAASSGIVVVLGTFSEKFPQQRFVTTRVQDICRYVREGFLPPSSGAHKPSNTTGDSHKHGGCNDDTNQTSEKGEIEEGVQSCDDFDMCNEMVRR
jgi:hypothetical protein